MRRMEQRLCIACSKEVPQDHLSCECGHVFEGSKLSTLGKRYTDQRACSEATFLHNPDKYFFVNKLKKQRKKGPLSLLAVDGNNNNDSVIIDNHNNNNNINSNNSNNSSNNNSRINSNSSNNISDNNNKELENNISPSLSSKCLNGMCRPSRYRRRRRRNQKQRKVGWNTSAVAVPTPEEAIDEVSTFSEHKGSSLGQCLYGDDVLRAALDEINKKLQVHARFWSQTLL